ncbi:5-hydroxytryptamine receptor 1A-like [Petromyzon marinus]|uniref:5-hydroxytryptamine receptor 1A-like n=1 Tax=Petromyzon marinus TaxID=7757 RepID=UPI003F712C2E
MMDHHSTCNLSAPLQVNLEGQETAPAAAAAAEVSLSYQVLTSMCLGALILFSIVGNSCVIAAIVLERSLQNVANYLIGSLAVTDLMVSVLVLPMAALYQVLGRWTLGQVVCDIFIALDVLCCTSSILHLCAIALDRYWAITNPIDYVNKRTPRRAVIMISLTWLVGFSISIPPMLGWRTPADRADPNACKISQDHGYTIYSTFGAFYIPLILMLVLYGRIFKAARFRIRKNAKNREKRVCDASVALNEEMMHRRLNGAAAAAGGVDGAGAGAGGSAMNGKQQQQHHQQQQQQHSSRRDSSESRPPFCCNGAVRSYEDETPVQVMEAPGGGHCTLHLLPNNVNQEATRLGEGAERGGGGGGERATDSRRKTALARERKTVKTLGIIMGTFIFCWLPFFIVALISPFCGERCRHSPPGVFAVINWLGYSNSLLNPIIYAYFNKDFQNAFKKIVRCRFCRK